MLMYYILIFGCVAFSIGLLEIIIPKVMMSLWIRWTSSKLYFIHGIILIIAGFPLTQIPSSNPLSIPLFIIGLIIVFTGPFILIYPEKVKKLFLEGLDELGHEGSRLALIIDALFQIIVGIVCAVAFFLQ